MKPTPRRRSLRSQRRSRGAGFLGAALLGLAAGLAAAWLGLFVRSQTHAETVVQPVAFNHRIHVEDEGLDCTLCHAGAEEGVASGLPADSACALCHAEPQGEGAEEEKLVALLSEGRPLAWQPLFAQPDHVFYSHRMHVAVAGLACEDCHGDIGLSERPPERGGALSMEACIECHEAEGAPSDCTTCHR